MKKFSVILFSVCLLFTLACVGGCSKTFSLKPFVNELRSDIYEGQSENYNIRVAFGFNKHKKERADGSDKIYGLTFKLLDKETDSAEYSVSVEYDGQTKKTIFSFNPVSHSLVAFIELDENFNQKQFDATIYNAGQNEKVTLTSVLPANTITYESALNHLYEQQTALIDSYKNQDGEFSAQLQLRVIVKDQKSFWYVGITESMEHTKALLVDGITGEVLSIREIL